MIRRARICGAKLRGDILQRMQTHLTKKRSMLRDLKVAERFLSQDTP
jgi:hypothetical protein